jgi:hypothetical protein
MTLSRRIRISCAAALTTLAIATPTVAAEPAATTATTEAKRWEFKFVPYLWAAGVYGDLRIGRLPTQGIEASFSDIWDHLQIAGMLAFEVRKDRWGLLIDAVYVDLSDSFPTPDEVVFGDADVSLTQQLYSGLIAYRIYDSEKASVDMAWGARYFRMDTDLSLSSGAAAGRSLSKKEDWVDWLAGVRAIGHPSKRWSLMGYADIGGGGSQLTWEGIFAASFAFNKTVSLAFGYRYLSTDYVNEPLEFDAAMQGPFLGVGFQF